MTYLDEEKVAICKDVLKQLELGKIRPKSCYLWFDSIELKNKKEESLQTLLEEDKLTNCYACAKGALFFSYVLRNNNFMIDSYDLDKGSLGYYSMREQLSEVFDLANLDLIECAYEQQSFYEARETNSKNDIDAALAFTEDSDTAEERMIAIMNNMIVNNGVFVPPQLN